MTLWISLSFSQLREGNSEIIFRISQDVEYTTTGVATQEFHLSSEFSFYDAVLILSFADEKGVPLDLLTANLPSISGPKVSMQLESGWLQKMNMGGTATLSTESHPIGTDPENDHHAWQRHIPLNPYWSALALGTYILLGGISAKLLSENIRMSPYWGKIGLLPAAIASINIVHYYYLLLYTCAAYVGLRFWTVLAVALLSQAAASAFVVFITIGLIQGHGDLQQMPGPARLGMILYFSVMFLTVLCTRQIANSAVIHGSYLVLMQLGAPIQFLRYLINKKSSVMQPVNHITEFRWEYNICYFFLIGGIAFLIRGSENPLFLLSYRTWAGISIVLMNVLPPILMLLIMNFGDRFLSIFKRNRAPNRIASSPDAVGSVPRNSIEVELMEVPQGVRIGHQEGETT
jgi:hypothetical protein